LRRARSICFLGLSLFAGACSGTPKNAVPAAPAASASGPKSQSATPSEARPGEVDAKEIVDRALVEVAEMRKLAPKAPVKGAIISREALRKRIENDLLTDLEPELIEGTTELLFALNLTRADFDFFRNLLVLYGTQLAGYYDPRQKEMVLLDDLGVEAQVATLWHELVHALQDQHYDLQTLTKWSAGKGDAVSVAQSFAEGDAMSAMMDMMLVPRGQSALDVPESVVAQTMASIEALPEVRDVPSILKRSIVAPYTDGIAFTHTLRREGDWPRVDEAWRKPPETTEQLLHPEKFRAREAAEVLPMPKGPPGGPATARFSDVLGEQTIRLVLEEWVPLETARNAAAGWAGDRVAVFIDGDKRAAAIALRYDDEASARRALEAMARGALSDPIESATRVRSETSEGGQKAARAGRHCSERDLRGPFAVVRSGRDLGVTLGPYTRDNRATRSAATCATALSWAAGIATELAKHNQRK
jgi:hypothetical protein